MPRRTDTDIAMALLPWSFAKIHRPSNANSSMDIPDSESAHNKSDNFATIYQIKGKS
jgi:hypothetical protein